VSGELLGNGHQLVFGLGSEDTGAGGHITHVGERSNRRNGGLGWCGVEHHGERPRAVGVRHDVTGLLQDLNVVHDGGR